MTTKRKPEVDPKEAPCTDGELKVAMQNLRRPPRRKTPPASAAAKGTPKDNKKAKTKRANPVGLENETPKEKFDLKGQLSLKEQRFIELYLTGDLTVDKAMESAGYVGYHKKSLYRLSRKIVEKYESSAGDHRKIMRAMGYGETKAIEMLIDSAENAKSEMVRLTARITLAKCLGLHQDVVAVNQGIQIIIRGRGEGQTGGGRPAQVNQDQPRALPATLSITK